MDIILLFRFFSFLFPELFCVQSHGKNHFQQYKLNVTTKIFTIILLQLSGKKMLNHRNQWNQHSFTHLQHIRFLSYTEEHARWTPVHPMCAWSPVTRRRATPNADRNLFRATDDMVRSTWNTLVYFPQREKWDSTRNPLEGFTSARI